MYSCTHLKKEVYSIIFYVLQRKSMPFINTTQPSIFENNEIIYQHKFLIINHLHILFIKFK